MLFLVIPAVWIVLTLLVIGVCLAARLGDQAQREPSSPVIRPHRERGHPRRAQDKAGEHSGEPAFLRPEAAIPLT